MKKIFATLSLILGLLLASCSSFGTAIPTPTPIPTSTSTPESTLTKLAIPDIFKTQIMAFLEKGEKLHAATGQGINYVGFRDQLAEVKASYSLAKSTWPKEFAPSAQEEIGQAILGWDYTLKLWEMKVNKSDEPVEPDINLYKTLLAYGGDDLIVDTHPVDFLVPEYQGKKFLPFDNIGVLMSLASNNFEKGKGSILTAIQ